MNPNYANKRQARTTTNKATSTESDPRAVRKPETAAPVPGRRKSQQRRKPFVL